MCFWVAQIFVDGEHEPMTVNPETEIVASSYDSVTRNCTYTIQRGDKRWTIAVPLQHLDAHKGTNHKVLRRNHVALVLELAMQGEPDADA